MPIHSAIHYFMCQTVGGAASCVLATSEAASNMETRAVLRPLGAIQALYGNHRSGSAGESGSSILYEAVSLRSENPDDEWMYQLAHQESNDPNAPVRAAVALAVSGRFVEATKVLSTFNINHTHTCSSGGDGAPAATASSLVTRVLSVEEEGGEDEATGEGAILQKRKGSSSSSRMDNNFVGSDVLLELCLLRRLKECIDGTSMDFAIRTPPLPVHMW